MNHQLAADVPVTTSLREQQELARKCLDLAGVMLVSLNPAGKILLINQQCCALLGVSAQEVLGKNWFDHFVPGSARDEVKRVFTSLLQGNIPAGEEHEHPVHTGTGEEKIIAFHNTLLIDDQGQIAGMLFSGRDITERRQMEKALQESEQLYRNLVETTSAVLWEIDLSSLQFTYISPQVEELTGFPPEEWPDFASWAERVHPDDREYAINFCQGETARGNNHAFEYRMINAQGEVVWIRDVVNVIMEDGRPVILRGHFIDISEQKQMALALQKAHDELELRVEERTRELQRAHEQLLHAEKLSAIGRLAASIAHEFNNPLQGTMNIIRGVARRATLDDDDAKLMAMASNECIRMRNLIKSLQDFNRPTSGIIAPTDLHAALDSLLLLTNKEYSSLKIRIVRHYAKNLPLIRVVADQIKQVFLNLLTNAADACPGGGVITIATEALPDRVVVRVQDTGTGIDPAIRDRIFEPFFTTKPAVKGTGLGLSVSYGIIRNHGGEITVTSVPGQGTTFAVILPIQGESHAHENHPAG